MMGWISILLLCAPLGSQEDSGEKRLTIAFKDASIETVLRAVSRVTGWAFVQDFLNLALRRHGLTVLNPDWPRVPGPGQTLRVVDLARAPLAPPPLHVGLEAAEIPASDELRTQLVPLKGADAAETLKELGELFRRALGEGGQAAVSTHSNSILLSGRSDGIRRAVEILRAIDETSAAQLKTCVLPLRYLDAVELAKLLNEVWKREPAAGPQNAAASLLRLMRTAPEGAAIPKAAAHETMRIIGEPRTNSLLVTATEENVALVRGLLVQLDLPEASLNTYVVRLIGIDASAAAALLNRLYNSDKAAAAGRADGARSDGTLSPGQVPFQGARSGVTPSSPGSASPRR